jgi:hypothetical protein
VVSEGRNERVLVSSSTVFAEQKGKRKGSREQNQEEQILLATHQSTALEDRSVCCSLFACGSLFTFKTCQKSSKRETNACGTQRSMIESEGKNKEVVLSSDDVVNGDCAQTNLVVRKYWERPQT